VVDGLAAGVAELERSVFQSLDGEAAVVEEAVVAGAEEDRFSRQVLPPWSQCWMRFR
jgi:hypothetical protein